ncbi:hypothetical protein L6R29_18545 [Myxococcota bacterium]|nr:hypothetical protein [Myxococcota bacterium]
MEEFIRALPPPAKKALEPDAPTKIKKLAASGRLPMSPLQQITLLYLLSFDSDTDIAQTAVQSIQNQPESTLLTLTSQEEAPLELLDFLARHTYHLDAVLHALILHKNTPDPILAWLASHIQGPSLDLIALNQQRQLRHPPVLLSLLQNPHLNEALRARVAEFALRSKLETGLSQQQLAALLGKEGAQELLSAAQAAQAAQAAKAAEEAAKAAQAAKEAALAAQEAEEIASDEVFEDDEEGEIPLEEGPSQAEIDAAFIPEEFVKETPGESEDKAPENVVQKLLQMTVSQKIKAASKGNKQVRGLLINESNRLIAAAVLKNPGLTDGEVIKIAASRSVSGDVIRQIATNREWMRIYRVKVALASNPKCPRGVALRILPTLRKNDIRDIAKNKGISSQVAGAANKLYKQGLG